MKKITLAFLFFSIQSIAQQGEWAWIKGSDYSSPPGSYGIQGVTDTSNVPSGTYEPVTWTDHNGNFWFFGGMRLNPGFGELADMWKYDPATNNWTWIHGNNLNDDAGNYGIKGVPSVSNVPPGRGYGIPSWVDNQGNLWMYGGHGPSGPGDRDDLWKFDITTNQWTWVNGSISTGAAANYGTLGIPSITNSPGERSETTASWTDSIGNLYFFGGQKSGYGGQSDVWQYNISSNMWSWIKGPQGPGGTYYYGTKGVESPLNNPPGRLVYAKWNDKQGNFWMFGGLVNGSIYNDLWKYNTSTGNWIWMSGDSTGLSAGNYGLTCTPDLNNIPSARMLNNSTWTDLHGNLWLYSGGYGQTSVNATNDLWMYCIASNEWIWVKGDSVINSPGSWGTLGVSSPTNTPDGRMGAVSWVSNQGDLYLFGGHGPGGLSPYNDLWKFVIDTNCIRCSSISTSINENQTLTESVFPNPATDEINIRLTSNEPSAIMLTDMQGREIQIKLKFYKNGIYTFDIIDCTNGVYNLRWESKTSRGNSKILICK